MANHANFTMKTITKMSYSFVLKISSAPALVLDAKVPESDVLKHTILSMIPPLLSARGNLTRVPTNRPGPELNDQKWWNEGDPHWPEYLHRFKRDMSLPDVELIIQRLDGMIQLIDPREPSSSAIINNWPSDREIWDMISQNIRNLARQYWPGTSWSRPASSSSVPLRFVRYIRRDERPTALGSDTETDDPEDPQVSSSSGYNEPADQPEAPPRREFRRTFSEVQTPLRPTWDSSSLKTARRKTRTMTTTTQIKTET
jgi:hypothetical protein